MTIPLRKKVKLGILFISSLAVLGVDAACTEGQATARELTNSSPANASSAGVVAPSADLVVITLDAAIRRAQANEPAYAAAVAASRSAGLDQSISRAGLRPNVRLYSEDIYTQPNGIYTEGDAGEPSAPLPRFVANDSRPRSTSRTGVLGETLAASFATVDELLDS